MRIAISGTHGSGKSTLIDAFLERHAEYAHEPEPYEALEEMGEPFAAEPTADDFYRQLEYQLGRLHRYQAGERVIFERSPVDFLAYLLALGDLGRDTADAALTRRALEGVLAGVARLDVIAFLPAEGAGHATAGDEDPRLRRAVDARLQGLLLDDDLGLFAANRPAIVEARGTTARRLRALEGALFYYS